MATFGVVLGGLALAGVVFLLFGYAASLKLIRQLQDELVSKDKPAQAPIDTFSGDRPSFVLVTDRSCPACSERVTDLAELYWDDTAEVSPINFTVVLNGEGDRPPTLPSGVGFINDADLVGRLGVSIFPVGLVFDQSGIQLARSVLGDRESMNRLFAWALEKARGNQQLEVSAKEA